MRFDGFYGNARVKEYFNHGMERGALTHAFLLSGPKGIGKRTLAGILARALVCQGAGERPCGVCPACVKSAKGLHPDILWFQKDGATVKVDEIRRLKQDAFVMPNDGDRKVFILPDGDDMTQQAQDALLKILEEPPEFTVFILLCYNEYNLLETVRSRCTRVGLAPLDETDAAEVLREKLPDADESRIAKLVRESGGVVGRVLDQEAAPEDVLAMRQQAQGVIDALATGRELTLCEYMISIEKMKRDELGRMLDEVSVLLRDALLFAEGTGDEPMRPQAQDATSALARKAGVRGILGAAEQVEKARKYCERNGGPGLILGMLCCGLYQAISG